MLKAKQRQQFKAYSIAYIDRTDLMRQVNYRDQNILMNTKAVLQLIIFLSKNEKKEIKVAYHSRLIRCIFGPERDPFLPCPDIDNCSTNLISMIELFPNHCKQLLAKTISERE